MPLDDTGFALEEEEEGLLLGRASPSPPPPPPSQIHHHRQGIRWDRIVTAGLGVMGAYV
jgi:hypothetical protein